MKHTITKLLTSIAALLFATEARAAIVIHINELPSGLTEWNIISADPVAATGTNSSLDLSIKLVSSLFVSSFIDTTFSFDAPIGIARNLTNPQSNSLSSVADRFNTPGFSPVIFASGAMIATSPGDQLAITNTAPVTSPILFSNIVPGTRGFDGGVWGSVTVQPVPLPEPTSAVLLVCGAALCLRRRSLRPHPIQIQ